MMLTVYIDFKSAQSYLALKPTIALAEKRSLKVVWRAFRAIEREVPDLQQKGEVAIAHYRARRRSQRALAEMYAEHQGIKLEFPQVEGSSDLALSALNVIETDPLPFINAGFCAYWDKHENLDDHETVVRLLDQTKSIVSTDLETARSMLESSQLHAESLGVVGAPTYTIGTEVFLGREHLPLIEERLKLLRSA